MKPSPLPVKPPLFLLLFFSIFGFIGVAVLFFLWFGGDGFGSPPLFFRVFGSFIALGFMAMGFGVPFGAIKKAKSLAHGEGTDGSAEGGGYQCPNCGANLKDAEVSPSGDVKCSYCDGWWNIHRG